MDNNFKIIGAGLPRTGTASLQKALEILGFGPTYHMFEVFKDAQKGKDWLAAFDARRRGEKVDWKQLVKGYRSGIDAPVSEIFIEMFKADPSLKVILTHRPADEWMKSINSTIMRITEPVFGFLIYWVPEPYWQRKMALEGLFPLFRERYGDPGFHEGVMSARMEEAKREIPEDHLLIFRVQEGWEPLCKFLEVPIPSEPFPRVNDAAAMERFMGGMIKKGVLRWLMIIAGAAGAASVIIPKLQKLVRA